MRLAWGLAALLAAGAALAAPQSVRDLPDDIRATRKGALDPRHATLLGVTLDRDTLGAIESRFGPADSFEERPRDPHARLQVCYHLKAAKAWVVFGRPYLGSSVTPISQFELHGKPPPGAPCVPSKVDPRRVATPSGLRIGMTVASLRAILGKPTEQGPGFLRFGFRHEAGKGADRYDVLSGVDAVIAKGRVASLAVWTISTT